MWTDTPPVAPAVSRVRAMHTFAQIVRDESKRTLRKLAARALVPL